MDVKSFRLVLLLCDNERELKKWKVEMTKLDEDKFIKIVCLAAVRSVSEVLGDIQRSQRQAMGRHWQDGYFTGLTQIGQVDDG